MTFQLDWRFLVVAILAHGSLRSRVAEAVTSTARQASEQDKDGWVTGRATFIAPSKNYTAQFPSSAFGEASAGSCGYYSGADSNNYSAVIVPPIMRAAAVESNVDFAGSCGRCYEVQCVNGPVIGNYSDTGAANLTLAQANPPYKQSRRNLNTTYPVDDKGTRFEGNSGEKQKVLTVQCHERAEGSQTIIQVTDSCKCQATVGNGTNPCCTNVPHFNIDYLAFQEMAHPDYGWMNMRFRCTCRPVDCISKQPGPQYLPGVISKQIFSNHPETGWGVSTYPNKASGSPDNQVYAVDQELNTKRLDSNLIQQNGSCFTFPSGKQYSVGMKLFCPDCDAEGYMPFALANSSGIELIIETAIPQTASGFVDGSVVGLEEVPHLLLNLGNNSEDGVSPCPLAAPVLLSNLSTRMAAPPIVDGAMTGLYKLRILWQNTQGYGFFECVEHLSSLTSIDIAPENVIHSPVNASYTLSLQVSFCLSNISILEPTLVSEEDLEGKPPPPEGLGNCFSPDPQPVNKDGLYVDTGSGFPYAANVSQPTDPNGFTAFSHTDLQNNTDLQAAAGQPCTKKGSKHEDLVGKCQEATPSTTQCCVDLHLNPLAESPDLPKMLASICNDIVVEGSLVCQAFTWDYVQQKGYFKGQHVNDQYDKDNLITNFTMCNSPSVTTWILNAALSDGSIMDTRELSKEVLGANSTSSGSSWGKKVWSAVGAVLGIASPVIAIVVFLLIFNSYRLEKKMLVKQVMKNMRTPDICAPAVIAIPTANPILLRSSSSLHNSGQLLLGENPFSGLVPGHPSRRRGGFGDPSVYDPDDPSTTGAAAAEEVQRVGKEITLRCLQRWDGFMGFRASTDSLGRQSGIWREKFDGVRIASLLLAFRKLNASLGYNQPGNTGSLYKTWTQSNFKHQGMLVSEVAKMLQSISVDEAQALPYKDPETIGAHDRLCGCWKACTQCCCSRK